MEMLCYTEQRGIPYCGWSDDGLSMFVRNPQEFVRHVVPIFFKGGLKFSSFQRKLYRWGFRVANHFWKRMHHGDETIVYRADHFQRDSPELIRYMSSVTATTRRSTQSLDKDILPPNLSSFFCDRRKQPPAATSIPARIYKGDEILSSGRIGSHQDTLAIALTTGKAIDDSLAPSAAAQKNALINDCSDDDIASLLKMYDLEPNPIADLPPGSGLAPQNVYKSDSTNP
jgi:hypothetical protein